MAGVVHHNRTTTRPAGTTLLLGIPATTTTVLPLEEEGCSGVVQNLVVVFVHVPYTVEVGTGMT